MFSIHFIIHPNINSSYILSDDEVMMGLKRKEGGGCDIDYLSIGNLFHKVFTIK